MKHLALAAVLCTAPVLVAAETVQSQSLEADLIRRAVAMKSDAGASIRGEQVYVTMRRRDGAPIEASDLKTYVPFAERAACQGRKVLVSLMVGATAGSGKFEVLCSSAS